MISVVYCTRETNPQHIEHLIKSSGLAKNIEVIEIINKGESLTKAYNRGLKQAKNDIVVFCHDDITIETKQWGEKLLKLFKRNPEYAILGVAGTKEMPSSGKWWENNRKMYGRVAHTWEGKTWLSSYSDDLDKNIEEVATVDGVFFVIDKTKIKKTFDESVEGFHFYDITFCFQNHLEDVKIGVTTIIRINHKSIGMTDESWEKNRQIFVENFKDKLPVNIKKVLRKNEKLKVLISCLSFANYTGSELYVFELAKQLVKQGCDVSICSNIGGPLEIAAKRLGVKLYSLKEPPSFKLGDGVWVLKNNETETVSQPETLYKISEVNFDVIHCNHTPITEHMLRLYPDTPMISTIHSEVISLENPVISPQIKKYIAIRPEIKEHLINSFGIEPEKIEVIYNPIDSKKFKVVNDNKKRDKKRILFVGTIDYLRKETIKDLIKDAKENDNELWLVGKFNGVEPSEFEIGGDIKHFPPTPNVEKYIQSCDETAGILLGRTTIEGWMCGKKGWIYNIDDGGNILSKKLFDVPSDIDKFDSEKVVSQIMNQYVKIIE
jgi:glycosyltransferase involved in cell wall biosynthesis